VVAYGPVNGSDQYVVYASNLDGSDLRDLGQGTWPTVSPDGSKTAYSAADGINIADNETGTTTHLPGTVEGDYHPLWSPDASQIAFVRIVDLNIYVVKADGSDLRQLTSGIEYELLAGWSPDGGRLYYTVLSQGGQVLRELGMASGAVRDLFTVGPKDVPSISPEGRRVAFADRVFGGTDFSLFVSSIDGSERRRIADSVADHLWSPDGKWLIVSMSDPDDMFAVPMPVLINVGTCEVTPLRWFSGYIQGWAP
jgi:Tol biopolymer transport system component